LIAKDRFYLIKKKSDQNDQSLDEFYAIDMSQEDSEHRLSVGMVRINSKVESSNLIASKLKGRNSKNSDENN
jgi:hypothetical protein